MVVRGRLCSVSARSSRGVWVILLAALGGSLSACCGADKPSKELLAKRLRCDGKGLPLGDGKCHQCPAGTTLQEESGVFREDPEKWPFENSFRLLKNDTGHGSPWGGSGRRPGSGSVFGSSARTYEDHAFCKDAQGKRQGPSGKWILDGNEKPSLHSWGYYKANLREGPWVEEGGQERGSYAGGKRHGRWVIGDGGGEYQNGIREGAWKTTLSEGTFRGGRRVGPWKHSSVTFFHQGGTAAGRYEDGRPTGTWTFTLPDKSECSGATRLDGEDPFVLLVPVGLWRCPHLTRCIDAKGDYVWEDIEGKRTDCKP